MFNNINFDYMENNNEMKKIDSSMVVCPYCKNVMFCLLILVAMIVGPFMD